ncbi:MAG: phosphoribosylamine--glycine ligase [Anaerolineae bacterium]|nr:phosphoribosylamine--glycine ligase [Gemmatimonadaceae bacterium]
MKALLVGSGGREHALAWKLLRDCPALDLIAAPGNPGIAELARCSPVSVTDVAGLLALARSESPDVTIVGPEMPLALGIADCFRDARLPVFGPSARAAEIESSKVFAKALMHEAGVPTARAEHHTHANAAKSCARTFGAPVVIKASGLAGGKGAIVCDTLDEANRAIDDMLVGGLFGQAGAEILVEEFMEGEEASIFGLTDGIAVLPMLPAQDHKRLSDGDRGPNTGGMGSYAPVSIVDSQMLDDILERVFIPALTALRKDDRPFTGVLYAGLMLTRDGPRVIEFNCRFGDPETEAVLPLLESNLFDVMLAIARGESVIGHKLEWSPRSTVTTVVAASGYPDEPRKGDEITLPRSAADVHIFHSGTAMSHAGKLVTAGGRVLAVTAVADTIVEAQRLSGEAAGQVRLSGKQFRKDIGWREIDRFSNR